MCIQSHEEYHDLQLAYEAMVDIADYTNESTRDYEMRQIIKDVQVYYFVHNPFFSRIRFY